MRTSSPSHSPSVFVGIDVSKASHVAGFLSPQLLAKHSRFEKCPTLKFANSRSGFENLLSTLKAIGPLETIAVLLEVTGHYHRRLLDYLQEQGITCYLIHVQERPGEMKTDKLDSLSLANRLYGQLHLGVQYQDKTQQARLCVPPSDAAAKLRCLTRHRYELIQETTRRKNKLSALCDELFPEFTAVFIDPNAQTALAIREAFPTAQAVADADITALADCRMYRRPSIEDLEKLQELARFSIGCKEPGRLFGLCFEQALLIAELQMLKTHLGKVDAEIATIIEGSREGKILTSIGGIGATHAATILASVESIANFETKGDLRKYFGWAPRFAQSGTSLDNSAQTRSGNRVMKQAMWLIAISVLSHDTLWRSLYERLVPRLCSYDASKKRYIGKNKVVGRIAGQLTGVMYSLLKKDYDLLMSLAPGETPPEPTLYSIEVHRAALNGSASELHS